MAGFTEGVAVGFTKGFSVFFGSSSFSELCPLYVVGAVGVLEASENMLVAELVFLRGRSSKITGIPPMSVMVLIVANWGSGVCLSDKLKYSLRDSTSEVRPRLCVDVLPFSVYCMKFVSGRTLPRENCV